MGFQLPTTIADAVKEIQSGDLVLPAIQREFVWEESKVVRLFDSVVRGYPIWPSCHGRYLKLPTVGGAAHSADPERADGRARYGVPRAQSESTIPRGPLR